jgi:beta-mannosidase
MENGKLENPFWEKNEQEATKIAKQDFEYERIFIVFHDFLQNDVVELVATGLDTLATIHLNGKILGKTDNIYRTWRFDVKSFLHEGENTIRIEIENPYPYFEKRQSEENLLYIPNAAKGSQYIRKTPCHFGWDWGPVLPPAGLLGSIALESYDIRIGDMQVLQHHENSNVRLDVSAKFIGDPKLLLQAVFVSTSTDGISTEYSAKIDENTASCTINITSPQLWWCNGLGEQPLYTLTFQLKDNLDGTVIDLCTKKIGLRTIELDNTPDKWGNQFRFVVNGIPIFAKGANWIPADSFITRTTQEDLEFYIKSAKRANMNMLRVWGGGMYESDNFYNLCDQYGILIWQDFIFACGAYPFFDETFVENVHQEVIDNVTRIRHHASLAVWCGNNENELISILCKKNKRITSTNLPFYHNTLRAWVKEIDGVTPYWPGSPSSGSLGIKFHNMKPGKTCGDTHLWQIWHGMLPIEGFRRFPTRFCSEFGMESMPSIATIQTFTDDKDLNEFSPVMQAHQKSAGGNEKILFYLLAKYRNPAKFEDFIYLSQIVQADTIRFATDYWRRGMGRHNGAIFWQYNDCWPVASWASIDYNKQYKALQYQAEHFNKMLCLSNDYFNNRAELYLINEYPTAFDGELDWKICKFDGHIINKGTVSAKLNPVSAGKITVLRYAKVLKGAKKSDVVLMVSLRKGAEVMDTKTWLLVPDKKAHLPKTEIEYSCKVKDDTAEVMLSSALFARKVFISADGVNQPWSDNFFDIAGGEYKTLRVSLPKGMKKENLEKRIHIRTLADVEPKNCILKDKLIHMRIFLKKSNLIAWIMFKFL